METIYIKGEGKEVIATDFTKDRDGERIDPKGVDIRAFKKNPVMLFGHNHQQLPVGTAEKIKNDGKKITFQPVFSVATQLARDVKALWEEGVLRAVSIGFMPKEREGDVFTKTELLEISVVSVPSNPNALAQAKTKGLNTELLTKATGNPNLEKFPDGREWDATAAKNRIKKWAGGDKENIDWGKYKQAFAYHDTTDDKNFSAYKLPFADVQEENLKAVWRGVATAEAALLGARGGVDLPDNERRKVHSFLGNYYKKFEREQPEFRGVDEIIEKYALRPKRTKQKIVKRQVEAQEQENNKVRDALHLLVQQINNQTNKTLKAVNHVQRKEHRKGSGRSN